jgi:hypothetical protein
MTVRLKSDRHPSFGPGFALIDFGRPLNFARLEISILNTITGLYLGPSAPGHPNWVKQRTNFFPAIRAGGENSGVYRVGPEMTTYIQEGTYVEVMTADGSVSEEFSWEGVLLRANPSGTENWTSRPEAFELVPNWIDVAKESGVSRPAPTPEELEAEANRCRPQSEEQDHKAQETASAMQAKRKADEQVRQRAEQTAALQRASEEHAKLVAAQDELEAQVRATVMAQARREADEQEQHRVKQAAAGLRAREDVGERTREAEARKAQAGSSGYPLKRLAAALVLIFLLSGGFAIVWKATTPLQRSPTPESTTAVPVAPPRPELPIIEKEGLLKISGPKLVFSGPQGGPFDPQEIKIVLSVGDVTSWSVEADESSSIRISPTQGTLPRDGWAELTVGLAPSSLRLVAGHYVASAIFRTSSQAIRLLVDIDVLRHG